MAIIQWDAAQTKTVVYAPGDIVEVSSSTVRYWELDSNGNDLTLHAYNQGTLTLHSPDGSPLSPSQLSMTLPDGGKFIYGADNTPLTGGDGNDLLLGSAKDNTLDGGAGDDFLLGNDGNDTLAGGSGENVLVGGAGDDRLTGGPGQDALYGGSGNDTLDSGGGNGGSILIGDTGDDRYLIRSRDDIVFDSDGNDSGIIYADWYKPSSSVEHWEWAPGVQKLPYWIDALHWEHSNYAPMVLRPDAVVYYSFAQVATDIPYPQSRNGFEPFTIGQMNYTRKALEYISTLIDVRFEEISDSSEPYSIVLGNNYQEDSSGYAYAIQSSGGMPLLIDGIPSAKFPGRDDGAYLNAVLLHELGHSLGLKHPFSHADGSGNVEAPPYLPEAEDNTAETLMSYSGDLYNPTQTYSPFDIATLQYLWGVSAQAHAGDSRYVLGSAAQMIWDGSGNDTVDGSGLQADLTLYLEPGYQSYAQSKNDLISAPGQYTINFGTQIENAVGGAGNDTLTGNGLDNRIEGGAGNDTLAGNAGNDRLDGGAGTDTALFHGALAGYTVAATADGYTVTGADGTDTLANIERLRFSDATIALDTGKDGVAGQVYRLYQAAFDRQPDAAGLAYWMEQSEHGMAIGTIANSFLRSDEFSKLYGGSAPAADTYLTRLYNNVLHRPYDQGGYDYWMGVLKGGTERADVLLSFANSDENITALAKVIGQGFNYASHG